MIKREDIERLIGIVEDEVCSNTERDLAFEDLSGHLGEVGEVTPNNLLEQFPSFSMEKIAKFFYGIRIIQSAVDEPREEKISLCKDILEWLKAKSRKQVLLCQQIEARLAVVILKICKELTFLSHTSNDMLLCLEINLLESKLYYALKEQDKAWDALEAAKKAADAYGRGVPRANEGAIDLQRGFVLVEKQQYLSAFNRFRDAYERGCQKDIYVFKCMILCKLLSRTPEDVNPMLEKYSMDVSDESLETIIAFSKAFLIRSWNDFNSQVKIYETKPNRDPLLDRHLTILSDILMVANVYKLILGYLKSKNAVIDIAAIATLIGLSSPRYVMMKIREMLEDKKIAGTLRRDRYLCIHSCVLERYARSEFVDPREFVDSFFIETTSCHLADWRLVSILPVRDQKTTNACLLFALVDLLYAAQVMSTPLAWASQGSEQELLDCIYQKFSHMNTEVMTKAGVACNFFYAHKYVSEYKLATAKDLPFKGKCMTAGDDIPSREDRNMCIDYIKGNGQLIWVNGYMRLHTHDEVDSKLRYGLPVVATTIATTTFLKHTGEEVYKNYSDKEQKRIVKAKKNDEQNQTDNKKLAPFPGHAVLLVGFGETKDVSYYIAKSSYGDEWGHKGYIKINKELCMNFMTISYYKWF